jgi:hypothetical protein
MGPAAEKRRALAQNNARQHRWIAQAGRQHREVVRWGYRRKADLRVSTTDPDASPMQHKNKGTSRLGYQTHYVVDGGKARVILDVLVTPAEVTENLPMLDLLFRSRFRWRLRPHSVTADAAYGTTQNIAAIEKAGIRAYLAVVDHEKRTSLFGLFGRDAFTYDAQKARRGHLLPPAVVVDALLANLVAALPDGLGNRLVGAQATVSCLRV